MADHQAKNFMNISPVEGKGYSDLKPFPDAGDYIFNLFMKMFFYLGLVGFLPYLIIHIEIISPSELSSEGQSIVSISLIISIVLIILMDSSGFRSSILDRLSRLITLIVSFLGFIATMALYLQIRTGWGNQTNTILFSMIVLASFNIMGWFFVRAERGILPKSEDKIIMSSMWAILPVGLFFLLEFFIPHSFLFGIMGLQILFPIFMLFKGHLIVVPKIKPKEITRKYQRVTFYNYVIDAFKAFLIIITVITVIYNGNPNFFPTTGEPRQAFRNLGALYLCGGLIMGLYENIQDILEGQAVVIIFLGFGVVEYSCLKYLNIDSPILISIMNGVTFSGIMFFLEQKIDKSNNIRALPGSFYLLIYLLIFFSIIFRLDPETDQFLGDLQFILSLMGLAYIYGYFAARPARESYRISL